MKTPNLRDCLPRGFYDRSAEIVAQELLGKALLRKNGNHWMGGWIVETEAYLSSDDPSSHSHRGPTQSNASMFEHAGTLYVYPIHAKYCLNAVTEKKGKGSAVLIRAIEPVWGIERMIARRGFTDRRRLTRGPGMLCQALDVDRRMDGADLVGGSEITITTGHSSPEVSSSCRVGISRAQDLPLRFFIDSNWYVSGRSSDHQRRPCKPIPRS